MSLNHSNLKICSNSSSNHNVKITEHIISAVAIVGTLADLTTFILFIITCRSERRRMTYPVSMTAIALLLFADGTFLLIRFSWDFVKKDFIARSSITTYVFKIIFSAFARPACHSISNYTILAIAFIRFFSLRCPLKAKKFLTHTTLIVYMSVVVCVQIAFSAFSFYYNTVYSQCLQDNNTIIHGYAMRDRNDRGVFLIRVFNIILFHATPAVLITVLIAIFLHEFYHLRKQPRTYSVPVDEDQHNIETRFMHSHLIMAVKSLVLNNIAFTLQHTVFINEEKFILIQRGMRLIVSFHFATTWILVIFLLPFFATNIADLFRKCCKKDPSNATDLTLHQLGPFFDNADYNEQVVDANADGELLFD